MKLLLCALVLSLVGCASTKSTKDGGAKSVKKEIELEKTVEKTSEKAPAKKAKTEKKEVSKKEVSQKKFQKTVTCTVGGTERILENRTADAGGCEVVYTKNGGESIIANAENNLDYCQEVVDRVANKLSNAGFSCQ